MSVNNSFPMDCWRSWSQYASHCLWGTSNSKKRLSLECFRCIYSDLRIFL